MPKVTDAEFSPPDDRVDDEPLVDLAIAVVPNARRILESSWRWCDRVVPRARAAG
jgi:hypothetical protein